MHNVANYKWDDQMENVYNKIVIIIIIKINWYDA